MPSNTPEIKVNLIKSRGAKVILCEPTTADRQRVCAEEQAVTGATLIPPYDYLDVIEGQGTIALEILEDCPDVDAILVPVSGGGMLAGVSRVAKELKPTVKVYAVEPEGKRLGEALTSNTRVVDPDAGMLSTIADGTRTTALGETNFPICRANVEHQVLTVSDAEIKVALRVAFETLKVVMEPSGALGLAALLSSGSIKKLDPAVKKVAVIISGGNIAPEQFFEYIRTV